MALSGNRMHKLSEINFVLVGMPSSGKSTIARIFSSFLGKELLNCDEYFDQILNQPSNKIALDYFQLRFPNKKNEGFIRCEGSEDFIKHYGEDLFRDYEEYLNIRTIEKKETTKLMVDLPGKIFMRKNFRQKLKEHKYVSIFLNVDKNILIQRLSDNQAWMQRSIYKLAEENGYRWKKLFNEDYNERYNIYSKADIIYNISQYESPMTSVNNIIDAIEKYRSNVNGQA